MEIDFLVGGQPHVAADGDYIRVAVILKKKVSLGGERPDSRGASREAET